MESLSDAKLQSNDAGHARYASCHSLQSSLGTVLTRRCTHCSLSVRESIASSVATIGENLNLRRVAVLPPTSNSASQAPMRIVGAYMHSAVQDHPHTAQGVLLGALLPTVRWLWSSSSLTERRWFWSWYLTGRIGSLVTLEAKDNSVSQHELETLGSKLAMHIAAAAPLYLSRDTVPARCQSITFPGL